METGPSKTFLAKVVMLTTNFVPARQQSSFTVTGMGGRSEDVEIIGNGTLVIWRVSLADEGQYTCAATNDVGDPISKTVNLKINGKHQPRPGDQDKTICEIIFCPEFS